MVDSLVLSHFPVPYSSVQVGMNTLQDNTAWLIQIKIETAQFIIENKGEVISSWH